MHKLGSTQRSALTLFSLEDLLIFRFFDFPSPRWFDLHASENEI